jgi:peptidoglycan/xylan/chitin deacetylase (PgdA/CDA1 family)
MHKFYMKLNSFYMRAVSKYRRTVAKHLNCKMAKLHTTSPIISFSFDDAPRTAFIHGGDILKKYGARATFYVSLGMLESDSPSGPIASLDDLQRAVKEGDDLGCHTFDHQHSWETKTKLFVQSVQKNRQVLSNLIPGAMFSSFAYPMCAPKPAIKQRIGKLFNGCRGGGQTFNVGDIDLNLLKAFFLDVKNGDTIDTVKQLIDENAKVRGWLIFATHDIDDNPSRYGCSKKFFEEIVKHSAQSGALLLPVGEVCEGVRCQEKICTRGRHVTVPSCFFSTIPGTTNASEPRLIMLRNKGKMPILKFKVFTSGDGEWKRANREPH